MARKKKGLEKPILSCHCMKVKYEHVSAAQQRSDGVRPDTALAKNCVCYVTADKKKRFLKIRINDPPRDWEIPGYFGMD